ncbi:hypothetical protein GCM10011428_78860 [Streptomyces violaceus]|uniref:hypothetical protein n=1 Tax=Streptomyces violaceus TaxID=1936 RepID=UPI0031EDD6D1
MSFSGDDPTDFTFDPETGRRFDADPTSLNETDGFGSAWVEEGTATSAWPASARGR